MAIRAAMAEYAKTQAERVKETPFGVEYRPNIWGAGWGIQSFGVNQYFLHKGYPDLFPAEPMLNSLNFVLGVHPGNNTASFVSGVGVESIIVAYGVNRDEWSYIPGGSVSGTALIRPDLPELKIWPYFWQQTEYVMGGRCHKFYVFCTRSARLTTEMKPKTLLFTPPFTQMNTPYPATMYLKGFLNTISYCPCYLSKLGVTGRNA
ncbi:MAG: hypothetical protein R3C61_20730 [Bacteroidia bacterium]